MNDRKEGLRPLDARQQGDVAGSVVSVNEGVGLDDPRWQPIDTAPRDGTIILVMDPDAGIFAMRYSPLARNPLFQRGRGLWCDPDNAFTWSEQDGFGPSKWMPLP